MSKGERERESKKRHYVCDELWNVKMREDKNKEERQREREKKSLLRKRKNWKAKIEKRWDRGL